MGREDTPATCGDCGDRLGAGKGCATCRAWRGEDHPAGDDAWHRAQEEYEESGNRAGASAMFWARATRAFVRAMWRGDVEVPWWVRAVHALAMLYVIIPLDAIRDYRLPGGLVDDLLVAVLAWLATAEAFERFRKARGWAPPS